MISQSSHKAVTVVTNFLNNYYLISRTSGLVRKVLLHPHDLPLFPFELLLIYGVFRWFFR